MSDESMITALKEELERSRCAAAAEKQAGQEFISSVSHELRTPVAVIRGSLEALCDGVIDDPAEVKEYHRQMLAESIYLQHLVNDLLEYSRLQNRVYELNAEPVNVCDVADDVFRSIKHIASAKNVEFVKEMNADFYFIWGDYVRLRQMLIVLLDNAVKFTSAGGKVTVRCDKSGENLKVQIIDTGCGIKPEDIDGIFIRFHRAMSDQNRNGTGLGLPIAKEIAERHGAKMTVQSEVGKGTTFTVDFNEMIDVNELEKMDEENRVKVL